jgi:hypothetical protein
MTSSPGSVIARRVTVSAPNPAFVMKTSAGSQSSPVSRVSDRATGSRASGSLSL